MRTRDDGMATNVLASIFAVKELTFRQRSGKLLPDLLVLYPHMGGLDTFLRPFWDRLGYPHQRQSNDTVELG